MLKNCSKYLFLFLLVSGSFSSNADYEKPIEWNGNLYKIVRDYEKVHKTFFKKVCKPSDPAEYYKLLRNYRGQGFYLPKLGEDIDRQAIIQNLHHFSKKMNFIDKQIERLKKLKVFPHFSLVHSELDKIVKNLLNLKKQYHQAITKKELSEIERLSKVEVIRLKKQFKLFVDQIFFLQSYGFPNDYLAYREKYEAYKDNDSLKDKKIANKTFFFRKIVEDGAYDPDRSRPDKFIRTALDTLYLEIVKLDTFISENVRYDLEWIESKLERILERGKAVQLKRLGEWKQRVQENFKFYQDIIDFSNKKKAKNLVAQENDAAIKLKNYVYSKQAEVYQFWQKQSELYKALFSLETILVHEVGVIDGKHGLERASVARVVLNRFHDDFYSQLESDQPLVSHLPSELDTSKEKWLNVLFKIGEFSFTYHYIPAVVGIHCPDMSRRGRSIRKINLKIALKALRFYEGDFKALRYFSRISMMGKIDMSSVWTDYERLPEMAGYKSLHQNKLQRYYLAGNFNFLYSFKDENHSEFTVVKIKDITYSMRWEKGKPVFYDYRNPHLFAYFSKKN